MDTFLTTEEVARRLHLHQNTVIRYIREGRLPATKVGNAIHATMKVPLTNSVVLVTGCGPVGLMVLTLAKLSGARRIIATDTSQYRLDLAKKVGADVVLNPAVVDVRTEIVKETAADSGVDILLEMSGSPEAIRQGFGILRPGGQAILMGLPQEPVLFDFANAIIAKGITAHGIVGRLMYETWDHLKKALDSTHNSRAIDLAPIITHRFMIEEFEQAMELMCSRRCGKVILFMDEESMRQSYDEIP